MKKVNVKEMLIVNATIIALFIAFNPINPKVEEEITGVAKHVEEFGSSWYVDENRLDKSFKHGVWNPKMVDSEGRVVGWKVKRKIIDFF